MAGKRVEVQLGINADVSAAKKSIQDLQNSLNNLHAEQARHGFDDFGLNKAVQNAKLLEQSLNKALNVQTGKLDLTKFSASLKEAGTSLNQMNNSLLQAGSAGQQVFLSLANSISQAEVPLKRTSRLVQEFSRTMKNTVTYQLSATMFNAVTSALSNAVSYTKNLNSSLNDIRIVTGQSAEQMAKFAQAANASAQKLSTTTNSYAKASLIFYQQGLSDAEVKKRTDAVIKMANVTKESMEDVSSYMTAVWNNFDDGTKSLEHYADVMTALGAATASSTKEIAAGLEKFASIGKTIGLSYDYATSALATIVSKTRQSADTVGTGLRTIFSRLQGLSLGETLEDGVDLNKYSKALHTVGVDVLDATGNMRQMDAILESLAGKWQNLSTAQKTALAQTVGGVRQYTTLISLMDNWDSMEQNLNTAKSSTGALQHQQDIYAESWEAAAQRSKAALEELYATLLNDKGFIAIINGFTGITKAVSSLTKAMGGLPGILGMVGMISTKVFSQQIGSGIESSLNKLTLWGSQFKGNGFKGTAKNVFSMIGTGKTKTAAQMAAENEAKRASKEYSDQMEALEKAGKKDSSAHYAASAAKDLLSAKTELLRVENDLSSAQKKNAQEQITALGKEQQALLELKQEKERMLEMDRLQAKKDAAQVLDSASRLDSNGRYRTNDEQAAFLLGGSYKGSGNVNSLIKLREKAANAEYNKEMGSYFQKYMGSKDFDLNNLIAGMNSTFGPNTLAEGASLEDAKRKLAEIIAAANQAEKEVNDVITKATAGGPEAQKALGQYVNGGALEDAAHRSSLEREKLFREQNIRNTKKRFGDSIQTQPGGKGKTPADGETRSKQIAQGAQAAMQAVSALTSGITQASNAMETFGNASATAGDKASAALSVASGLATSFATGGWVGAVAYAVGALGMAGYNAIDKAYRAEEIAAEKAEESVTLLRDGYKEIQQAYDDILKTVENYDKASKSLDSLVVGTDEWKEALIDANEAALELIKNFNLVSGADYTIGTDGSISFTKEGQSKIDQGKSEMLSDTLAAQATVNMAEAEAARARAIADADKVAKSNDQGRWAAAGAAAAGGAGLGAWGGTALGSIIPGLGNVVGGIIGALVGGVGAGLLSLFTYDKLKEANHAEEKDKIDELAKIYARTGKNDEVLERLIDEKFAGESESFKESIMRVVQSTVEAEEQLSRAMELAAQAVLNANEAYTNAKDEQVKKDVSARAAKMYEEEYNRAATEFDEKISDEATREQWQLDYLEGMDLTSKDGLTYKFNSDGSMTYSYIGDDGHRTQDFEVSASALKQYTASSAAQNTVDDQTDELLDTFTTLRESGNQGKAAAAFGGQGLRTATYEEFSALAHQDYEAYFNSLDADTLAALGYTGEDAAQQAIAAFRKEVESENGIQDAWDQALSNLENVFSDDLTGKMSLDTAQAFTNTLEELNKGPLKNAGEILSNGIANAFSEAGVKEEDMGALLAQISNIDWSDYDAFEQFQEIMEGMGYSIDESSEAWVQFEAEMRQAGMALPDFSKMKKDLNEVSKITKDLDLGSIVSEEDYQTLVAYNAAWEDFFVLQADGSRKFIGDSEAMQAQLEKNIEDQKDLLDLYERASKVEGVNEFNWNDAKRDGAVGEFADFYYNNSDFQAMLEEAGYTQTRIAEILSAASEGNTAELEALFTWIGKAVDPETIKQTGIELEQMLASMATTVEELQALHDLGSENGGIGDDTYRKSLIALGSGYEYCATAIDEYREALATGNPEIIAAAEDALEASIIAAQAAEKYEEMYSHALSGKSSMTLADLKLLKETNEELYNSYLTMSETDWYKASYEAYAAYLDSQLAGYAVDSAEYKALMMQKQQLNEEYYDNLAEKNKEAYDNLIDSWEEEIKTIESAVDAVSIFDDGTLFSEQSFENIAKLESALQDVGYTAEEIDKILRGLGKDGDKTKEETIMAAAKLKTDLLLKELSHTENTQEKTTIEVIEVQVRSTTPAYNAETGELTVQSAGVVEIVPDFDDATLEGSVLTLSDKDGQPVLTVKTAAGDTITVTGAADIQSFLAATGGENEQPVLTWNAEKGAWDIAFVEGDKNGGVIISGDASSFVTAVTSGYLKQVDGQWVIPVGEDDSIGVTLSFTPDENNSSTHIEWDEEAGAYTVETADGVINIRVNPDEKFSKITTDGNILSFLDGEGKEVTYTIGTDFDSMEKSVNEAGQLIYSLIKDGEVINSIVDVSSAEEALLDMWSTIANIEIVIDITYQETNPQEKPVILSEAVNEKGQIVKEIVYVISYDDQGRKETLGVGNNSDLPTGEFVEYSATGDFEQAMVVSTDVLNEVKGWLFEAAEVDTRGVPWNHTTALIGGDDSSSERIVETLMDHFNWLEDWNTFEYSNGKALYGTMTANTQNRWGDDAYNEEINYFNAMWEARYGMEDDWYDEEHQNAFRIMWDDMSSYVLEAIASQQSKYGGDFYSYDTGSGYGFHTESAIDTLIDLLYGYGMYQYGGDTGEVMSGMSSGDLWEIAEDDPEFMAFYNDALTTMLTQHAMNLFPELESEAAYDALMKDTDEMSSIMDDLLYEFTSTYGDAYNLEGVDSGGQLIAGMIVGIVDSCPGLWDTLDETTKGIIMQFKEGLGIASPSKHTIEMGHWLAKGLEKGLAESDIDTSKFTDRVLTSIFDGLKTSLAGKDFNEFKDTFLNSLLPENFADSIKETVITAVDNPNDSAAPAADIISYETTDGQVFTTQAAAQAHQRSLTLGDRYGMSVQESSNGKTYDIVDSNKNILSSGHANKDLANQALEDAIFYSGIMANYFAENPIEGSINFLTDTNYSTVQKGYIQALVDDAVAAFNEAHGESFESWDEIIAVDPSNIYEMIGYLDEAYTDTNINFLQSTKVTWAKIKDIWGGAIQDKVQEENAAAKEVYNEWVSTFKAIVAARKAILNDESFASALGDEDQLRLIKQWGLGGVDNETIMSRMFSTDGRKESDLAFEPYNPADGRVGDARYLGYTTDANGNSYMTSTSLTKGADGKYITEGHVGYANFEQGVRSHYGSIYDDNFMSQYGGFITDGWAQFVASMEEKEGVTKEESAQDALLKDPDALAKYIMDQNNDGLTEDSEGWMTLETARLLALVASDVDSLGEDVNLRDEVIEKAIDQAYGEDGLPQAYQTAWEKQMQDQIQYNQQMLDYETARYNDAKSDTSERQAAIQAAIAHKQNGTPISADDLELLNKFLPEWQSMTIGELEDQYYALGAGLDDATYALAIFTAALASGAMFAGYDANGNALFSRYENQTTNYGSAEEANAAVAAAGNGTVTQVDENTWQVNTMVLSTPMTAQELDIDLPERTTHHEDYARQTQFATDASEAGFSGLEEQDYYIASAEEREIVGANGETKNLMADKEEIIGSFSDGDNAPMREQAEHIASMAEDWDDLNEEQKQARIEQELYNEQLKEAEKRQRKYANEIKKMEKAYKKLADEGDDLIKVANDADASFSDQQAALAGLREIYEGILGPMEGVSDEWLKNADNLELAKQAAAGNEEAMNKLQVSYLDALTGVDLTAEANSQLAALAQTVAEYPFENLEIGATINDTDFLAKCVDLVDKCGLTAEQASAALSAMGVDAKLVKHEQTTPPTEEQIAASGGIYVPDPATGEKKYIPASGSATIQKTGDKYVWWTLEGATYNGKGVTGGGNGGTGGGGGRRRGGGGGGGGRAREARRANHANKDDYLERYHEIDNVIDDLADAYDRLNNQEDRAWGPNRIKAMKEQADIIKKQVAATEEKIRQAEKYLELDKKAAEAAGWMFDENGNVMNYDEFMNSQVNKYNAAIDAYNKMSAEEQEKLDEKWSKKKNADGEYYSGYEDYLKQTLLDGPKEALEQYEETMELLEDLGMDYDEFLNAWHDNIIGQIQTKLDTTLEVTGQQLDYLDYKLSRIEDDAYKTAEAIGMMADKMDVAQTQFEGYKSALDDLLKAYNGDWSADALMNGDISIQDLVNAGMESGDIELITQIMSGLMDVSELMSEQLVNAFDAMTNSFEDFNEDMDRFVSTIEHAQTVTSTYRNILDLTGRTMTGFNSTMLKSINDATVAQSKARLSANKTRYETIQQEYNQAKTAYERAQSQYAAGIIDAAGLEAAKSAYETAQDNLNTAQEDFLASWEEALQAAAEAFQSNMEAAIREVGDMMSGGLAGGLAELEDQFAKLTERESNYVDDYEKIYQLTKMTRDLNSKIDSTSNVRAQKELLKYQKELNGLLESDQKMSAYDLDYLQKKLDLKMAEIAMDEAQNAKSQVTMRRDSEGNYNYVYTADEDAVARAESEYADKLYQMQVANDEYITSLSENMASLSSQMLNEIAAIDTTIYDTEEKYQAEVQRITQHYAEQMEYYNSEMNKVLGNNKTLYEQDWTNFSKYTGYKLSAEEDYVTKWSQTVLSQVTGFESQEEFYKNFNTAVFGSDPSNPSSDSLIGRLVAAYITMRQQIDAANAAAGVSTTDLASAVLGNIQEATDEATQAATDITTAAETIVTKINDIGSAVTNMVNNYSEAMQQMQTQTDAMLEVLLDFLIAYGEIGDLDIEPGILAAINERRKQRQGDGGPAGYDTGGYTGSWGSEGRLAYLHQKELVLNAADTANMLASVGILRQIASVIDLNALASAGGFGSLAAGSIGSYKDVLQQEVHIEAHFPNATDKNQIEDAFKDIVNLAAQYANRS